MNFLFVNTLLVWYCLACVFLLFVFFSRQLLQSGADASLPELSSGLEWRLQMLVCPASALRQATFEIHKSTNVGSKKIVLICIPNVASYSFSYGIIIYEPDYQ